MRLYRGSIAAAGVVVVPINPHTTGLTTLPMMYGSSTVNATAQVDATMSEYAANIPVTVSRSATTVTVTFPSGQPHTLGGTSDYIVISNTGNSGLDGAYAVASVTSDTVLTYTSGSSGTIASTAAVATPLRFCKTLIASAAVSATTPAFPAVSATTTVLMQVPFSAYILKCTSYTAGTIYADMRESGIN